MLHAEHKDTLTHLQQRIYEHTLFMQSQFLTTACVGVGIWSNPDRSIPGITVLTKRCIQQTQQYKSCGEKCERGKPIKKEKELLTRYLFCV